MVTPKLQLTCAEVIENNRFRLIVICALTGDFERYYAEYPSRGMELYAQQRQSLSRVERAMRVSVTEKGISPL